jgi:hypothetical protein
VENVYLTDIDGVDDRTAEKLKGVMGLNRPENLIQYEAGDLADKAGVTEQTARNAIQGAGGNPDRGMFDVMFGEDEQGGTPSSEQGTERDNSGFFTDPIETNLDKRRLAPTEIGREPNGEFTYPRDKIGPADGTEAKRGPDGKFVSNDLRDPGVGREESTGLFDLFL